MSNQYSQSLSRSDTAGVPSWAISPFVSIGLEFGERTQVSTNVHDPAAVPIYMHFDLTPQQFVSQDWIHRRNLQLHPLVDAAELLRVPPGKVRHFVVDERSRA